MTQKLIPRPDQEIDIKHILDNPRTLCANDLGTGKTLVSVEAAHRSESLVVVICAPLNTFTGWERTVLSQTGQTLRHINAKKAGKEAFEALAGDVPGWYIINWELMRRYDWRTFHIDFLIMDESAKLQNRKSRTFKASKTFRVDRVLLLSGSPFGNKIEGAWASLNMLWPEKYKSFWNWVTEFLRTEPDPYTFKKIVGEKSPGAVVADMPSWIRRKAPYEIELAVHTVEVAMAPAQAKIYKQFEQAAIVFLNDNPLIAELPAVKHMRLRQIALAVPTVEYDEDGEARVFFADDAKSAKLEAMLEVIEDLPEGEPQLIWTHSKQFVKIVAERLKAKGYKAEAFHGDIPKERREEIRAQFGKEVQFICATIQSAGTGLDGLQLAHIEHLLSLDENRMNNYQMYGRLRRGGQERIVNRFVYRSKDTLETRVVDRITSDDQLMNESVEVDNR